MSRKTTIDQTIIGQIHIALFTGTENSNLVTETVLNKVQETPISKSNVIRRLASSGLKGGVAVSSPVLRKTWPNHSE